jgi:rhodanese-related sulfurtransferase
MPVDIGLEQLDGRLAAGAQLVEVLPRSEYLEEHLPGAVSIPLRNMSAEGGVKVLDAGSPVVVYCWDSL